MSRSKVLLAISTVRYRSMQWLTGAVIMHNHLKTCIPEYNTGSHMACAQNSVPLEKLIHRNK